MLIHLKIANNPKDSKDHIQLENLINLIGD